MEEEEDLSEEATSDGEASGEDFDAEETDDEDPYDEDPDDEDPDDEEPDDEESHDEDVEMGDVDDPPIPRPSNQVKGKGKGKGIAQAASITPSSHDANQHDGGEPTRKEHRRGYHPGPVDLDFRVAVIAMKSVAVVNWEESKWARETGTKILPTAQDREKLFPDGIYDRPLYYYIKQEELHILPACPVLPNGLSYYHWKVGKARTQEPAFSDEAHDLLETICSKMMHHRLGGRPIRRQWFLGAVYEPARLE